jgi:peptidoglycan hydrolase CwlO-like protein
MATSIFTSKAQLVAELKQDNETLTKANTDLQNKLEEAKDISLEFTAVRDALETEKANHSKAVESLKQDFAAQIKELSDKVAALTEAKAKVEETAKAEVAEAKTIKQEEVQSKVNEAVMAKVASMGLTEDILPPKLSKNKIGADGRISIIRYEQGE